MIARVRLLLPSYVGMLMDDYVAVQVSESSIPDYEIIVHPPIRVRREIPDGYHKQQISVEEIGLGWQLLKPEDVLTDNTVAGKSHWWANCLVVDFKGDAFPRDQVPPDIVKIAADIANDLLMHLRWRGNQYYIKEIPITQIDGTTHVEAEYLVEYLDNNYNLLPKDSGYRRSGSVNFRIHSGAITPENWKRAWSDLDEGVDIPLWEQLLLDVAASEPDGRAVIMSFTALEVFIRRHVDLAAAASSKDDSFWKWLINRDGNYDRQPAVAELLDQVLYFVDGRSLKTDSPDLWSKFQRLKRARNRLVHEGQAPNLTRKDVSEFVRAIREIIDWVRQRDAREDTAAPELTIRFTDITADDPSLEPRSADDPAQG